MSKVGCLSKVTSLTRKLSGGGVTQNTKLYTDALITKKQKISSIFFHKILKLNFVYFSKNLQILVNFPQKKIVSKK